MNDLFFVSCPHLLENTLNEELKKLQIDGEVSRAGVSFKGDTASSLKVLLYSRIASRVFKQIFKFEFTKEGDISRLAKNLNWRDYLTKDHTFKVKTLQSGDFFKNTLYLSKLLKDGIADSFKGPRPNVDLKNSDIIFYQRITKENGAFCSTVFLDMAGFALSNRGYRLEGGNAPIRENVAAAVIDLSGYENGLFIDSMTGSGTLIIEAMLKHANVAPSFLNTKKAWSFLKVPCLKKDSANEYFRKEVNSINSSFKDKLNSISAQFIANDIDVNILNILKNNLTRCHIPLSKVKISSFDATKMIPPEGSTGMVIANMPYGKRMTDETLEKLYYDYGENLKHNFKGFDAFILTSGDLRKKIGLRTKFRVPIYNGDLECRLLKYNLY